MRIIKQLLCLLVVILLASCGGGGGGVANSSVSLTGRVINIVTGGSLNPAATIQTTTGATTTTSVVDGSFTISSPINSTSLIANAGSIGVFTFTFPAATQTPTDVGDLWVGPEKVTVTGFVRDASSGTGLAGCRVSFGGQNALTDANGQFALANVAYSSASPAGFLGLVGNAQIAGFFPNQFTSNGNLASAGIVAVGDVLLSPLSDTTPPGSPYTIWGRISPAASAPGTVVTLKQGGTPIRRYTVGADGRYQFWVPSGSYTVEALKGAQTGGPTSVNLPSNNEIVRQDVSLL